MKAILIVTVWTSIGPSVSVQALDAMPTCRLAMQATAQMLKLQAMSNLLGMRDLILEKANSTGDLTLRTPGIEREVVRLRCVGAGG